MNARPWLWLSIAASFAACSGGAPPCTLHEMQPVALFAVISSSNLPSVVGDPTITLTLPSLDGSDRALPASATDTIELSLGDAAQTGATCDASDIENALSMTGADVRDSINLLKPTPSFSITCVGAGAWESAQITLRASGVTVPLAAATPFTMLLDFTVDIAGAPAQISGTQAVGVVDVASPGGC